VALGELARRGFGKVRCTEQRRSWADYVLFTIIAALGLTRSCRDNSGNKKGNAMNILKKLCQATVVSMALAISAASALAQTTLTMSIWVPRSHPLVKDVLLPMTEDIAKATDGRVKVNVLPAPLGPPPAHFDLVANGVVDLAQGNQVYTPGRFKTADIAEMPFLGNTSEAISVAYWHTFQKMLINAHEYDKVKVLAVFSHGPGAVFAKGRDLTKPDALKGMKIRVGGGIAHDVASALGAVPIEGPSSKAYELLSQGVADGIFFPFESVESFKVMSLLDQGLFVPGGLYNTSFFVVMNKAKWDALSDEDKKAIDSVTGEALVRKAGKIWDKADADAREAMKGKITVQTASPEQMSLLKKELQPLIEAKIAEVSSTGINGKAAYDMMQDELKKAAN
jgi:TRAP-type transport system periplasmic protein